MNYELGTYKFIKQPNQHKGKFIFRVKKLLTALLIRVTKVTGLFVFAISLYIYGSLSLPVKTVFADREVIHTKQLTDFPILEKIAKCESDNKQFKANGDVIRGKKNPSDIGKYQINEYIHNDKARSLGFDIFTEQGNHDMAVYLFTTQGTEPWNSSKPCWSK